MENPFIRTTPGITQKRFTRDPLGTEGELTDGPDDQNPFRSAEEREAVEAHKAKAERQQRENGTFQTSGLVVPYADFVDPTQDDDPFVFDDIGEFQLPGMESIDPFNSEGPRF